MSNKVHFIGVAGSAIAPIAIMMKELGWEVTGSDENVFEPALTLLNNAGVKWYEGYSEERVKDADLVIIGGGPLMKDPNNPEYTRAKKLKKKVKGYAYLLQEHVVKDTSIVVTGSYGKTTTTSIINWILETAGKSPSFMIGGKPMNFSSGVRATNSDISCTEGDEFVSVYNMDHKPRFVYYKPTHAIVSAAKWDHINVYPTEEEYIAAYKKLVEKTVENKGQMYIAKFGDNNNIIIEYAKKNGLKVTTYAVTGSKTDADFTAGDIEVNDISTKFTVYQYGKKLGVFESELIGIHNVENCLAAITVTKDIGIELSDITDGIKTFAGIARRLQILGTNSKGAIIIDDFAHSAMKAQASIEALKSTFPNKNLIAIYNPRLSAREDRQELDFYKGAFDHADKVILPKIIVKRSTPKENRIYGSDIVMAMNSNKEIAEYIPKESNILQYLDDNSSEETIISFMSASGWGSLMQDTLDI